MNREKKLIKNTFILGIGTLLPKAAQFITLPIYTATLTKFEYGTYDLVIILSSLIVPILTLQNERAAFRFLIEEKNVAQRSIIITNVYAFIFPIAIIASCIILLLLRLSGLSALISLFMAMYVLIDTIVIVTRQLTRGLGENRLYSGSAIINSFFNVFLAILLLSVFKMGLAGLLISLNVALFLSLIFLLRYINIFKEIKLRNINIEYLKFMLKFSIPMVPNSLSLWIVQVSDRLIVTAVLGVEANAVYAVANKIPGIFAIANNTFNMAWQESASTSCEDNDSALYYSKIFDKLFNFLVGIMSILIGFAPVIFGLLVRGSYEEAYNQMPILFLGIFFASLSAYYGGIYLALKETKRIGLTSIFGAVVNFVVNISLIRYIGLYAASISTLVSYVLLTIYRLIDTRKLRNLSYKWEKIFLSLLILTIMSSISYQRKTHYIILNMILGLIFGFIYNIEFVRKTYEIILRKIGKR